MKLSKLLEQELQPTFTIPVSDIRNIDNNIDEYVKAYELTTEQRNNFIQTIIRMMQKLSRKMEGDNKYDSFIRRLSDEDEIDKTLNDIKQYNNKIIISKEKPNEEL